MKEININVNINAPQICEAISKLAAALGVKVETTQGVEKIERSFLQTKKDTTHVVSFFVCGPPNGKRSAYLRFVPFFPERLCASCWRISSS